MRDQSPRSDQFANSFRRQFGRVERCVSSHQVARPPRLAQLQGVMAAAVPLPLLPAGELPAALRQLEEQHHLHEEQRLQEQVWAQGGEMPGRSQF